MSDKDRPEMHDAATRAGLTMVPGEPVAIETTIPILEHAFIPIDLAQCDSGVAPFDGDEYIVGRWHAGVWLTFGAHWSDGEHWEDQKFESRDELRGWWSYRHSVTQEKLEGIYEPTHWFPMPDLPDDV